MYVGTQVLSYKKECRVLSPTIFLIFAQGGVYWHNEIKCMKCTTCHIVVQISFYRTSVSGKTSCGACANDLFLVNLINVVKQICCLLYSKECHIVITLHYILVTEKCVEWQPRLYPYDYVSCWINEGAKSPSCFGFHWK